MGPGCVTMAMIISTTTQKSEFLARLARIEAGTGSSKSTLYVGLDQSVLVSNKDNSKLLKKATNAPQKRLGLLEAVLCLVLGAVSIGLALYLRFSFAPASVGPVSADIEMAINGGLGLAMTAFAGYVLRMPILQMIPVGAVGVMAGVVAFHNLVHFYPDRFAVVFSPVWVDQVVTATDANSIIWRGVSFTL